MYWKLFLRQMVLALGFGWAASMGASAIPHGTVELLAETSSIEPGHDFYAGLNFSLEAGWHIYWINPGDAGEPPRVTWQLPAGITAGPIRWPAPKALPAFSAVDFGYQGQVLLLIPMAANVGLKTAPAAIAADIKLIVCREVCVPGKAQVALSLPVADRAASPNRTVHKLFDRAEKQLPRPAPGNWKFEVLSQKDSFRLTGAIGHPIAKVFFFPLEPSQIENAAPQNAQATKAGFVMTLKKSQQLLKPIRELKGVLLLGDKAYAITVPVQEPAGAG